MTPIEEPQPNPAPEQAMPWVWLVVALFISLICFVALVTIVRPPGMKEDQLKIHRILSKGEMNYGLNPLSPNKEAVLDTIIELKGFEPKDPAAKGTRARSIAVLRYLADRNSKPDVSGFTDDYSKSEDALTRGVDSAEDLGKANEAIKTLVSSQKLEGEERAAVEKTLTELGARWPLDAAMREPPDTPKEATHEEMIIVYAFLGVLLVGTACLIWVFASQGINQIPLAGTPATGDNLGARFLVFLIVMSFVGSAISTFFADRALGMVVTAATIGVLLLVILSLRIKGREFNATQIGLRTQNLGKDILYGVAGFLANIPVLIILIVAGMYLLRWIPSGGHPIQYDLFSSNIALLIIAIGPLTGFVEEVAFRGLLFQGITLRYGFWAGILLSSIAFAMIHPQGGALWLGLAWIGGMGAYLTYKRSSLIPAIVMHALHNSAIVIIAIIAMG